MPLTNVKLNLNVYTSKRDDILQQFFNLAKSYFSKNPNLTTQQKINWFNEYQKRWFGINLANTDLGRIRDNISYSRDVEDYLKLFNQDEFNNYVINWGRNNGLFTNTGGHSGDDYLHNVDGLHGAITWMRRPGQYTTDSSELDYYNQRYADFFKENNMEGAESFFDENGLQLWRDKNSPTTSPSRFNFGNYSFKPDYKFNFGTLSSPFGSISPGGLTQPSSTVNPKLEELKIRYPFLGKILFPEHSFKPDYTLGGQYPWMGLVGSGGKVEDEDPDKEPRWYEKVLAKLNNPIVKNDLMGLGRVILDNAANNRYTGRLIDSLSTGLKQPSWIGRRVYGDYAGLRQMYDQAARLENKANQAFSSDANLTQATRLEAYDKAQQYRQKGDLIDNERIAKTDELAWQLEAKNVENLTNVANYNRAALAELGNKKAEIRFQNSVANMQNWDKFLSGILKRYKVRAEELELAQKMANELEAKKNLPDYSAQLSSLYAQRAALSSTDPNYTTKLQDINNLINDIQKLAILQKLDQLQELYGVVPIKPANSRYKIRTKSNRRGGKIVRMAGGGLTFVQYTPVDTESASKSSKLSSSSSSSKSDSDEFSLKDFLKDVFSAIKGFKGLTTDIHSIITDLMGSLSVSTITGGMSQNLLVLTYLSTLDKLNRAKNLGKEYENAYNLAKSNDALNELAVTSLGQLVVRDKDNKITLMSPQTYLKNLQNYMALTNRDVLLARDQRPDLAFDPYWSSIVDLGIGGKKLVELLNSYIGKLGNTTLSLDVLKGVELLKGVSTGQIEITNLQTVDLKRQVAAALNELITMLPTNVKALLYVKGGGAEGMGKLITDFVTKGTSDTYKFTIKDFDATGIFSGKKGKSKDGEGGEGDKTTTYQELVAGRLGTEGTYILNPGGNGQMTVTGRMIGALPAGNNDIIPGTTITNVLNAGLGTIVSNRNNITIGNHKLDVKLLGTSVYDGNGGMRVLLPINSDGTVNLEVAEKYNKLVEQAISETGSISSPEDRDRFEKILANLVKEDSDLSHLVGNDGKINYAGYFAPFLAVTGYTVTDGEGFGDDEDFVDDVSDNESEVQLVESLLTTDPKHPVKIDICDSIIFEFSCQRVYKGTIYIPLSANQVDARHGLKVESEESVQNNYNYQQLEYEINKRRNALNPNSNLLNN